MKIKMYFFPNGHAFIPEGTELQQHPGCGSGLHSSISYNVYFHMIYITRVCIHLYSDLRAESHGLHLVASSPKNAERWAAAGLALQGSARPRWPGPQPPAPLLHQHTCDTGSQFFHAEHNYEWTFLSAGSCHTKHGMGTTLQSPSGASESGAEHLNTPRDAVLEPMNVSVPRWYERAGEGLFRGRVPIALRNRWRYLVQKTPATWHGIAAVTARQMQVKQLQKWSPSTGVPQSHREPCLGTRPAAEFTGTAPAPLASWDFVRLFVFPWAQND